MDSIFTKYKGEIVSSKLKNETSQQIEVVALTQNLLKIQFMWNDEEVSFRCFHSKENEDLLFKVQQTVKIDYLIEGVGGFLFNNPKIHGGYIKKLNGLYFHVSLNYFDGNSEELYFFGKKAIYKSKEKHKKELI